MACEHAADDTVDLQCPTGMFINIKSANYGRIPKLNVGCNLNRPEVKECKSTNSKSIVIDRCQTKNSCSVRAANSVFGDPCIGVEKYLQVRYNCLNPIMVRKVSDVNF